MQNDKISNSAISDNVEYTFKDAIEKVEYVLYHDYNSSDENWAYDEAKREQVVKFISDKLPKKNSHLLYIFLFCAVVLALQILVIVVIKG